MSAIYASKTPKVATLFSEARFIEAVARADRKKANPIRVYAQGSNSDLLMCGLEYPASLGRRSLSFAPFGLYAYPAVTGCLEKCVRDVLAHLKSFKTTSFQWNVRYDHKELADQIQLCGLPCSETTTHVLPLNRDYETVFASFNATMRNHVRRAQREGVVVRRVEGEDSVSAYYKIHEILAQQKGNYASLHSLSLFIELLRLKEDVVFLVAEVQNMIVAGGWFFRDGDALFYWHGAMDRAFSKSYPMCAIFAYAIELGCMEGFSTFNMGGSAGIESLERFKSSWGAVRQKVWQFTWRSPFWNSVSRLKQILTKHA